MMMIGAIDVGSNAMRLAIGKFTKTGSFEVVATHREPVRLGKDVFRSGAISRATLERAVAAFLRFEQILKLHKVHIVRAVGTSALRDASNGANFAERVKRATGITLEEISGEEEARLLHRAVGNVINLRSQSSLLIDIGGGSVEISLVVRGRLIFSDSVRMGTVRLLEMMRGRRRTPRVIDRLVRAYAGGIRRQIQRGMARGRVTRVIGTGGNIESFGALRHTLLKKSNEHTITRSELDRIMSMLEKVSYQQRVDEFKLRPDRADVIMPAGALLSAIVKQAGVDRLSIPGVGLREGLLIDTFERRRDQRVTEPLTKRARELVAFAREFLRRYGADERHALHVAKLSLCLFDLLRPIHRLGDDDRTLLQLASLLHDVGYFIEGEDHHKHSAYIIGQSQFVGLSKEQKVKISLIARYHRGAIPSPQHPEWQRRSPAFKKSISIMAGIVRIVEEFDKEHLQRVKDISLLRRGRTLELRPKGRGELLVERWGAERSKELLEVALGRKVVIP